MLLPLMKMCLLMLITVRWFFPFLYLFTNRFKYYLVDRSLFADEYVQCLNARGWVMSRALVERTSRVLTVPGFSDDNGTYLVYDTNIVVTVFISRQRAFFDTEYMYQMERRSLLL